MPTPPQAETYYAGQARYGALAAVQAAAAWGSGDLAGLTAVVTVIQYAAASAADPYLNTYDAAVSGTVSPRAFAGIAGDGRPLATLFQQATDLTALQLMAATAVQDAGRGSVSTGIAARRRITGYVRQLNPPSCSRCAVLAGRWYGWNEGFQRHPKCFPAGMVVAGPGVSAATRRWFQGEIVVLSTASGQDLSLTGNHPVLTSRGWVPAHLLQEGDDVVRSTRTQGAAALVVPDHDQVPALIEDVWAALRVSGLHRVPSTTEDFHGDGQDGQVHVVRAHRPLSAGVHTACAQHVRQGQLARRIVNSGPFRLQRTPVLVDLGHSAHSRSPVRRGRLSSTLTGRLLPRPQDPGFASAAAGHASRDQSGRDRAPTHLVLPGQGELAGPGLVRGDHLLRRQIQSGPRWDAPGEPLSVETADGYAGQGRDLLHRLTGQVQLDRLVQVRRVEWSGHVFSLSTDEGWHSANSLIVSNCDCRHIPSAEDAAGDLTTDPKAYFGSLPKADQDRIFTKAGAEAIRDGADLNQVVNARAGMSTAQGFLTTTTNAAGRQRLMPESIYQLAAGDRTEAVRLLKANGFLT